MRDHNAAGVSYEEIMTECREARRLEQKEHQEVIERDLPEESKILVQQARDKGASSWLNALPIKSQNYLLTKGEFKHALRLRYGIQLDDIPSNCPCDSRFDVTHALSCKKGGFISQRHDNIRDLLTTLLGQVCTDVEAEPHLLPVTGEVFDLRSANRDDQARLDIKARGFWQRGQTSFFDVRVTHVNCQSQQDLLPPPVSLRATRKPRKESTNRGLWKLRMRRLLLLFLEQMVGQERSASNFSVLWLRSLHRRAMKGTPMSFVGCGQDSLLRY